MDFSTKLLELAYHAQARIDKLPWELEDFHKSRMNTFIKQCRQKNWEDIMNPIRSQLSYPNCWAFVATSAVEALYLLEKNEKIILSPQQLVNCCHLYKPSQPLPQNLGTSSQACYSYNTRAAFEFMKYFGGCLEADCMYRGPIGDPPPVCTWKFKISGWESISDDDELAIMKQVIIQPVAAHLRVSSAFETLKDEIYDGGGTRRCNSFDNGCFAELHAVLIVGFAYNGGERYWIVRNSWGEGWGRNGYGKIYMNSSSCISKPILQGFCFPYL